MNFKVFCEFNSIIEKYDDFGHGSIWMREIVIENDPEISQNQRLTERQVVLLIVMLIFCSTPNKKNRPRLNKFGEFARNVEKSGSAGSRDTMGLSQLHKFCAFCDSFWRDNKKYRLFNWSLFKGKFFDNFVVWQWWIWYCKLCAEVCVFRRRWCGKSAFYFAK